MSTLVQVMACRLPGDKPLPEPMMTLFTDAYTYTQAVLLVAASLIGKHSYNVWHFP